MLTHFKMAATTDAEKVCNLSLYAWLYHISKGILKQQQENQQLESNWSRRKI